MADDVGLCHLKKTCTNHDVTSNLKQRKHEQVLGKQSRGVMSARVPHSHNFSAWIERFKSLDFVDQGTGENLMGEAQIAAIEMRAKLSKIESDRHDKLKKFQQDVTERVNRARRQKLSSQLNKSIEKLKKETNVLCQTAFPRRVPFSAKDSCSFRSTISVDKIKNIMTGEANVDPNHNIENVLKSVEEIDQKAVMIKHQSSQARACLVSKIIKTDPMELPGGFWGGKQTKIENSKLHQDEFCQSAGAEDKQEDVLEALSKSFQEENERQHGLLLNDMWKNFDANGNLNVLTNNDMLTANDDEYQEKSETKEDRKKDKRKIHFQVPESEVIGPPTGSLNDLRVKKDRNKEDLLIPGHLMSKNIEEEKENKSQYWTCRKLFMDIEREKVRERKRKTRHKEIISRLKQEKESERSKIEKEVEVVLPNKTNKKQADEGKQHSKSQKNFMNHGKTLTRRKEILRYIDALKNLIHQKAAGNENLLPKICSCGNSILDANPDSCANNCIFYNNPKELARVLSSVLSGIEN